MCTLLPREAASDQPPNPLGREAKTEEHLRHLGSDISLFEVREGIGVGNLDNSSRVEGLAVGSLDNGQQCLLVCNALVGFVIV